MSQISGDLLIQYTQGLSDIMSLYGLEAVGEDVTITDNQDLATSQAWGLVYAIGLQDIGGAIDIHGNVP